MSFVTAVRTAFYVILRFLTNIVFKVFYRDYGVFHSENFPPNDGTPILFIAAPHGNFLMDAITIFIKCPRYVYFLSARSNFDYPIFGTLMTLIGCIPVTRPLDVKRVDGDCLVRVIEEGKVVTGDGLGNVLKVGDTLYVEFEEPDNGILKEANGIVGEIISNDKVRIKEPGMKWSTKGKRKGQLKRLVEYGSFVIRVDRENTITNLERFLPKNVTKTIDRLSSSPGVLTSPISDDQPHDITIHSSNPNQEVTEHTPLIPESSSNSRRSSNIYVVPDIPTTYSYTRMPPHSEVYSAVHNHFAKSNCIAIFPEGTSHDNEHMLSLKYGCAVMSLGYLASNEPDASGNPRRLKLVPCGLNFFDRHSFRSRVFVDIGPTIEIDNELIEMYRAGDESKRKASQQLLNTIHTSLTEITFNAPDFETLLFFKTASKLYREKSLPKKWSFSDKMVLLRKIAKKYSSAPLTEEFKQLKWDTISYANALHRHRLSLPHMSVKPISLILYLPLYLFLIILTIPGLIFFCPIGLIAQYVGKKQGENTMLYDENSLAITRWPGRYVIATWKMMTGIFFFIIFDLIYSILSIHFIRKFGLYDFSEREVFIFGSFLFFFFWTAVAYGTMLLWEGMRWVGKRTWVCMWSLAKPTKRKSYISRKEELSTRIWKWMENDN